MSGPVEPPLPPEADPRLGPLLSGLVACVCAKLVEVGRPACACCLVWGDKVPPADFCDCDCEGGHGQAWVRLVRMQPVPGSTTPRPTIKGRSGGRCGEPPRWQAVVEAGVYRCIHALTDDAQAPTCPEREADAWGFVADLRALRVAMQCCPAMNGGAVPLLAQPTSNLGGCGGAVVQYTVDL